MAWMDLRARSLLLLVPLALLFSGLIPAASLADTAGTAPAATASSDIQAQIDAHNAQISALQAEIAGYQTQLDSLSTQHQTLQSSINSINVSKQQTAAQISVTQNKMAASNLKLQELSGQISAKQYEIELDRQTLAQSVRSVQLADDASLPEQVFAADSLADAWTAVDATNALNTALGKHAQALESATQQLSGQQDAVVQTKTSLESLNSNLTTQQRQLAANEAAKAALLAQTKSKESTYQSLIAEKKAQEQAFESQLAQLQAGLSAVGPGGVPASSPGVLAWPFSAAVMATCPAKAKALGAPDCITQYFGNTGFSTSNPQIYNGMGHDGLDIGVPIGTAVHAPLSGTVLGTGNTDLAHDAAGKQCYSFGKWIMLQHPNGLDTLYAHLSEIDVAKGQAVSMGDIIGLTGETGYATGPHLHFGVYVGSSVQIIDLGAWRKQNGQSGNSTPCTAGGAVLPVAPVSGYLNPLSYLPAS